MKLIFLLLLIAGFSAAFYLFLVHVKRIDWKAFKFAVALGIILIVLVGILIIKTNNPKDTWCDHFQTTTNFPPTETKTATDWFLKGNFDYDTGNCKAAVDDYSKSIELNSKYPEAYNNKAYTEMRMGNYKDALNDLNKAIELNPNYVNALMNRGDIRNYYYNIDKQAAVADYEKIISLIGTKGTSVCGHLFMATHNVNSPITWFQMPFKVINCQRGLN